MLKVEHQPNTNKTDTNNANSESNQEIGSNNVNRRNSFHIEDLIIENSDDYLNIG